MSKVFSQNQRKPSIEEIAKNFNVDEQDIIMAMDSSRMPISIYSPIEEGEDGGMLVDRIEGDEDYNLKMLDNIALKEVIKKLDDRDKKIILLRYYFDKTQSEIAQKLNISQVQVSRLESKILDNLRKKLS